MPDLLKPVSPHAGSRIGRVDPRARLAAAAALSVAVALAGRLDVLAVALGAVLLGIAFSDLSPRVAFRRLLPLNALMLLLLVVLPLTTPGEPAFQFGPVAPSREGLRLAAVIALKGNTIVLTMMVLLGSIDATILGHALSHLRVPDKLTHLLLFTVRYINVLQRESLRLRAAMKIRGFRPGMSRHAYRSYGYLAGMLLVRGFDRSERVVAAMKCRGFRGRFYLFDHFHFCRADLPFCIVSAAILLVLILIQWA